VRLSVPELERQKQGNVLTAKAIPAQTKVFTNAASWRQFWVGFTSDTPADLDFRSNIVAAVFLGPSSPGHVVEITKVDYHRDSSLIVVQVTDWQPNPNYTYPAVIVYPGDVVRFPFRSGKVEFERNRKERK